MSSSTQQKFSNNPNDYPGQWIAWDSAHENIIAVADNYMVIMDQVDKLGETDPQLEHGPPLPFKDEGQLRDGESANIIDDIMTTIPDAEEWLQEPNIVFSGKRPQDLIGTSEEWRLRNMLRRIWTGSFS